jgi:hypothetical protein
MRQPDAATITFVLKDTPSSDVCCLEYRTEKVILRLCPCIDLVMNDDVILWFENKIISLIF